MLKDLEKQQAAKKIKPNLRRRIEQAGLEITPRTYYIISAIVALAAVAGCLLTNQALWIALATGASAGLSLPRWTLAFLKMRREKAFTSEFANAIDIIVRSVKSGLPTNEALKIVAREMPQPVAGEFSSWSRGSRSA